MSDNHTPSESDDSIPEDNIIETEGLRCPEPVLKIRQSLRKMESNQIAMIIADDPSTKRDIPTFCEFMDHQLVKKQVDELPFLYWIKKG